LKTPEEKLNSTGWQELTTSDGKTFYYNAKLRQSVWRMPPELKAIREKQVYLFFSLVILKGRTQETNACSRRFQQKYRK
jgi:Splicing factor